MSSDMEMKRINMEPECTCAICGQSIDGEFAIARVFPMAIYKWSEYYLSTTEYRHLKARIDSGKNMIRIHAECKGKMKDGLPSVGLLYVDPVKYDELMSVGMEVVTSALSHEAHKRELLKKQGERCAGCGCHLEKGILRRCDPKSARMWRNACIVCDECNMMKESFERKEVA